MSASRAQETHFLGRGDFGLVLRSIITAVIPAGSRSALRRLKDPDDAVMLEAVANALSDFKQEGVKVNVSSFCAALSVIASIPGCDVAATRMGNGSIPSMGTLLGRRGVSHVRVLSLASASPSACISQARRLAGLLNAETAAALGAIFMSVYRLTSPSHEVRASERRDIMRHYFDSLQKH